jgi:signal transduction histidine kinase/DNA-binding response OmpR family regulator
MPTIKEKFAHQSLYTKIILAFLFGCIVVLLSWFIARVVFRETFHTIEKIGQPNPKLRIVNSLLVKVHNLDQVQRLNIIQNGENAQASLINDSKNIILALDTLQLLYGDDSLQVKRLERMKDVLLQRDRLFLKYLKFHEELIHNKSFSSSMHELSDYISESMRRKDSSIVTMKQKTTTTTLDLPKEEVAPEKQESFFRRLFSRKKSGSKSKNGGKKQITEDVTTTTDTLAVAQRDSFIKDMESAIGTIEKDQYSKGSRLINHEMKLANASNTFINELQLILYQIQEEEISSLQANTLQLSDVFHSAFNRVGLILLIFLLLTIALIFLMFSDLSQSNRHRLELIEAKEKAQYMEKVKERFLANMSHEIRTPLQSIIGYSEQLKSMETSGKDYAEAIYRSSGYLLQIVNEILDYSRLSSGKFKFESSGFSMEEVLAEIADTVESQAEQQQIQFKFKSDIPTGTLHKGDSFRLKQILYNLLNNAVKFTEKGEVSFTVSSTSDAKRTQFIFEIKDTGIGMDEEQMTHIFNAFEQASESTQRHFGGTGLGLSITKTLVDMQRGQIQVSSKKGEGSTFTVTLGYLKAALREANPEEETEAGIVSFAGKVLVVDDDELILQLCSLILSKHGIDHVCVQSAEELLGKAFDTSIKLALIDIRMPEINGIELCNQLRKTAPAGTTFVALTAEVLPDEIERILSQGFDRILLKPFREKDLLLTLENKEHGTTQRATSATEFDLGILRSMCEDDEKELRNILLLMHRETEKDLAMLKKLSVSKDVKSLKELFHKLAARTGQAGATKLSGAFRAWEQELGTEKGFTEEEMNYLISALENFAGKLKDAMNA